MIEASNKGTSRYHTNMYFVICLLTDRYIVLWIVNSGVEN